MSQITKDKLKAWALAALIRAIKTWAQAGVAYIGSGAAGVFATDWVGFLSVSLMAFALSWLTSVAGLPEAAEGETLPSIMATPDGDHIGG